eukprot:365350-Chlamydomonas_euryale.AAC.10
MSWHKVDERRHHVRVDEWMGGWKDGQPDRRIGAVTGALDTLIACGQLDECTPAAASTVRKSLLPAAPTRLAADTRPPSGQRRRLVSSRQAGGRTSSPHEFIAARVELLEQAKLPSCLPAANWSDLIAAARAAAAERGIARQAMWETAGIPFGGGIQRSCSLKFEEPLQVVANTLF